MIPISDKMPYINNPLEKTNEEKSQSRTEPESTDAYPLEAYESIKTSLSNVYSDQDIDYCRRNLGPVDIKKMEAHLANPPSVFLQTPTIKTKQRITVVKCLGSGGSKKAYLWEDGRALLIPNMDADQMSDIQSRWLRMVEEEVKASSYLQKIGLMCSQNQKAWISTSLNTELSIPVYITNSFESLKRKNIYIIDNKNDRFSSTWNLNRKFFSHIEDAKKAKNWKPIFEDLIKDIAKIAFYNIPIGGDSTNVAIIKEVNGYKVRYFGFDFSSKHSSGSFFGGRATQQERVYLASKEILEVILHREFKKEKPMYILPKEAENLLKDLEEMYAKDILSEIQELERQYRR